MSEKVKLTFKEYMEHLWFYYKWLILFGAVLLIFVVVAIIQMLSKGSPDVNMLYMGPNSLTAGGVDRLEETVATLIDDYNDDGKKQLELVELTVQSVGQLTEDEVYNYEYNTEMLKRFNAEIAAGNSVVFLVDEAYYLKLRDNNLLCKLSDCLDTTPIPEKARDEYSVYLRDLDVSELSGFNELPRDSILCIRRSPEDDVIKYGKTLEEYNANLDFFKSIISYKALSIKRRATVDILSVGTKKLTLLGVSRLDNAIYSLVKQIDAGIIGSANYTFFEQTKGKNEEGNYEYEQPVCDEIIRQIQTGERVICIVDEAYYDKLVEMGLLVKLNDVIDKLSIPVSALEYGCELKYTYAVKLQGFSYMENSTDKYHTGYVCLANKYGSRSDEDYNLQVEFFKLMFASS